MKHIIFLFLMLFSLSLFCRCTEDPEPTLNFRERELVDSLYRMKLDTLKPVLDSLCTAHFDSAVAFKSDSMMKVRTAEVQKYLERLRRETDQ